MFKQLATGAAAGLAAIGLIAVPASAAPPTPTVTVTSASSTQACQVAVTAQATDVHGPLYSVQFFGRQPGTTATIASEPFKVPRGGTVNGTLFLAAGQTVDGISAELFKRMGRSVEPVAASAVFALSPVSCPSAGAVL